MFKVMQRGCSLVVDLDQYVWCPIGVCSGYTALSIDFILMW